VIGLCESVWRRFCAALLRPLQGLVGDEMLVVDLLYDRGEDEELEADGGRFSWSSYAFDWELGGGMSSSLGVRGGCCIHDGCR
jgi:hypothetical protein